VSCRPLLLAAVAGAAAAPCAFGVTTCQTAALAAPEPADQDWFGLEVVVDGDHLLVGAPGADGLSGAIHAFRRGPAGWAPIQQITLEDAQFLDQYGRALALDGERLLVGVPSTDLPGPLVNAGSVQSFVFDGTAWVQDDLLVGNDTTQGDLFGSRVALDGDVALVGAPGDDVNGSLSGSVYVFERLGAGWTQTARLDPSDGGSDDLFGGGALCLDGDVAVIGAPWDDAAGASSGAVYVFTRLGSWTRTDKLVAPGIEANDEYGTAAALDGDTLLVGARRDDTIDLFAGAVHVYTRSGTSWTLGTTLLASDGEFVDGFGATVALAGDRALVGAPAADGAGPDTGAVYVLDRGPSGWSESGRLVPAAGTTFDAFAEALAFDGTRALAGAPAPLPPSFGPSPGVSGSAHVFLAPADDAWTDLGGALSGLTTPVASGSGLTCPGETLAVSLEDAAAPVASAHLVVGTFALEAPFAGGTMVPAPQLVALALPLVGGGVTVTSDWPDVAAGADVPVLVQFWMEDASGPAGWTASNALRAP